MFKRKSSKAPSENSKYITRKVYYLKYKAPGVKVQKLEYLKNPKVFDPYYSIPLKYKKPGKLSWITPKGRIFVIGFGHIPIPPVLTLKFPKEFIPFSDIKEEEDDKESILGF